MKRILTVITTISTLSLVTFAAIAQDSARPAQPGVGSSENQPNWRYRGDRTGRFGADEYGLSRKASDLVGMEIRNSQDQKVGKVDDLLVDLENGRIVQVIVSAGGFLGIGDRLVAIPPGSFQLEATNKLLLNVDKEMLSNAPKYVSPQVGDAYDTAQVEQTYRHFGQEPYHTSADTTRVRELDRNANRTDTTRDPQVRTADRRVTDANSRNQFGFVQRVSKLKDTNVKNLQGETIGELEDMIVDLRSGRIVAAIISAGGFLGINDELSSVSPRSLRYSANHDTLQLDISKEDLRNGRHFNATSWPDFSNPRGFVDADNTAQNVRDRDNNSLTPFNQSNSPGDVDLTARIRKELVGHDNLSVNAENVKIITVNGRVTLRGPVNTAEEKRLIGEIARRQAPNHDVDNQLEIKRNNTGVNQ